jgi:uncharacterized protein involved in exopolysaccharide biosynthesis
VFPILETLVRRRWLVLGVPFAAAVLTSIVVLLMKPTYAATASFVPETSTSSRLPAGLMGLASQFGVNLGDEASKSPAFYADLLRSREILGAVLAAKIAQPPRGDSITVYELYEVRGATPELRLDDGIKGLRNRITLGVDQRTNVVHVTVEAPQPAAARDVLQLLLDRLADFNIHTRQSTAGERRKFIEDRVAAAEENLRAAEGLLRSFYERNRQFQSSPQLRFEEQRLNRQVAVQQDLYLTLRREYETARIEEVNNTPVLTVIDRPAVPGRRIRPQRAATVILVAIVVGLLSAVFALLLQNHEDLVSSADAEYLRLLHRIPYFSRRLTNVS